ncbi:nucleotidyltransferase family protein [Mumia sp. zg.B21]|uniref:nucleotidyltransferase family protein n=1 Tax=Mumia sp. zg.B21 TaxID=2855447 RepID=UPI001C6F4700|nr:nucleotidyltransferase family protein [Mumia sp. zg.B21]MBW9211669.1 nucleotidyltransferase family protein [Mumia sp. zg.B21]
MTPDLRSQLPLDEQVAALRDALAQNPTLVTVLERTAALDLPGWYVTAGAVFQTVWNVVCDRPADAGIRDYDVFYHDASDLSWEAEDVVVRRAAEVFDDLGVEVEVRNEARVHLWYETRFGVACPPFRSSEDAIDHFAATTCCVGLRLGADGGWQVYAPHGLGDVFGMVVRPNPVLAPRHVYDEKTARWAREWPRLRVLPWPEHA